MSWDTSVRGSADIKLVGALIFAVAGLSLAAYTFIGGRESSDTGSGPRVVDAVIDDDGNTIEASYTKATSDKQIDSVSGEIADYVADRSRSVLSGIDAPKGLPDGVSEAVVNAFVPVLTGDHDSFIDAIVAMGGKLSGELEEEHPIFSHLAKVFDGAKVDLARISVEKYEHQDRRMGMRREMQTEDVDVSPDERGPSVSTQVMELQPAGLFPDAPSKQDATAVQVKIPVQPKGEKNESIFGVILTWNTDAQLWQPAAYQVIKNRLMEEG